MRALNKKLFGLVFGLVVSIPFIFQGIGHKGWDPIGQMFGVGGNPAALANQLLEQTASQSLMPVFNEANANAAQQGRATTLDDVWSALSNNGLIQPDGSSTPNPTASTDPALAGLNTTPTPTFVRHADSITANFVVLTIKGTCTIKIFAKQASETCKSAS